MDHFVSATCKGERCTQCDAPAGHKVGEEFAHDEPNPARHNLTAYVCCGCFKRLMGGSCTTGSYRPTIKIGNGWDD